MTDRTTIARLTAEGLSRFADRLPANPVMLGFDGFVDSIIDVVDQRHDPQHYDAVPTIERFGQKVLGAAGLSANYELVVKLQKLGGNGPIMANAVAALGLPTTYVGAIGHPTVHPAFEELAKIAECHAVMEPGYTDALEFDDGKVMLGKYKHLNNFGWQHLMDTVGREELARIVGRSRLLGMVNWSLMPGTDDAWRNMIDQFLADVPEPAEGRRVIFVDLADPEKRTRDDLREALDMCTGFGRHGDVLLGLNLKEAVQVAEVLDVDATDDPEAAIEPMARAFRDALQLNAVVIHPRAGAAAAVMDRQSGSVVSAGFAGPYVAQPKLSTGAGDNFNAGFCLGYLAGLDVEQMLCAATATSGYYVRHAGSPTLQQLADFCGDLPEPK